MSFRKRLLVLVASLLLLVGLLILCAPFLVANGVRLWLGAAARAEGISIATVKIEAPLFGEVAIEDFRLSTNSAAARDIGLRVAHLKLDLNFRGWLLSKRTRLVRAIAADQVTGSIRHRPARAGARLDWRKVEQLLPDKIRIDNVDLDVITATSSVTLRGGVLSASNVESGKFFAREIFVSSPWLRQTFNDLRGATSWDDSRLTIAGISLARGLDLEALTLDFSRLTKRRLGLEVQLDAFGGTLRASLQGRGGRTFSVDLAGSAANISLAQISAAFGFLEPLTGSVHASKFTFRGTPASLLDSTASIWIELTDFAWRAHRAESVMLGATYYNRRLSVDQLYLRQRQHAPGANVRGQNELTLNGELLWPGKATRWTQLRFKGQINAQIPDLNALAELFGATTGDFAGTLSAEGDLDSLNPETHGRLSLHGAGVSFRGVGFDSLGAELQLRGIDVTLENVDARRGNDFLRGQGSVSLAAGHRYSGRFTGAVNDLAAYAPLLPAPWRAATIGGGMTFDWSGDGTVGAHSGTMQLFGRGLRLPVTPLRAPLDLTLEGSYSPQDVFFRTCRLENEHFSLGGFLLLGSNFVELQALQLTLDGTPRIEGTLFLPVGLDRFRKSHSLLESFDDQQKFDVDLAVHRLHLARLASALGETSALTGMLDGKLAAYGLLRSLQLTTNWHLENLGPATAGNTIDCDVRVGSGRADLNARALFGVSDPVIFRASLPVQLEKARLVDGAILDPDESLFCGLDVSALFVDTLPKMLRPFSASGGFFSGGLAFANTAADPQISGQAQFSDLQLSPAPPWPRVSNLSGQIQFGNHFAEIVRLGFDLDETSLSLRGRLATTAGGSFSIALWPLEPQLGFFALPQSGAALSSVRAIQAPTPRDETIDQLIVRGKFGSPALSLTMNASGARNAEDAPSQTTLFLQPNAAGAEPLLLRVAPREAAPVSLELRQRP